MLPLPLCFIWPIMQSQMPCCIVARHRPQDAQKLLGLRTSRMMKSAPKVAAEAAQRDFQKAVILRAEAPLQCLEFCRTPATACNFCLLASWSEISWNSVKAAGFLCSQPAMRQVTCRGPASCDSCGPKRDTIAAQAAAAGSREPVCFVQRCLHPCQARESKTPWQATVCYVTPLAGGHKRQNGPRPEAGGHTAVPQQHCGVIKVAACTSPACQGLKATIRGWAAITVHL